VNTLAVIFQAEFARRLRSRAFIAGTVIGVATVLLFALLPGLAHRSLGYSARRIVLIAPPSLAQPAARLLRANFDVIEILPRLDERPTAASLDAHHHASAVVVLAREQTGLRAVAYVRDPSLFRSTFAHDLAPLQIALATGMPVATIVDHLTVPVEVHDVAGRFADAGEADAAKGAAFIFIFLLYLAILLNAQAILTSVAEEKTSRIAEVLVAAVDPTQLLAAKILAVTATGFLQLGVWIATGFLAGSAFTAAFTAGDVGASAGPLAVSAAEILLFVAFFLVGFAQYSVLYAAAASLISRTEDIGSLAGPLVLPVAAAIVVAQFGITFPNSPSIVTCSFIPLLAPFVMFARIAVTPVPDWQLALSLTINVAVAFGLALLAGRVYRVGLLLYGRPPSLRQIVAMLRA
jgi:ABC-2 type transport system permease protein